MKYSLQSLEVCPVCRSCYIPNFDICKCDAENQSRLLEDVLKEEMSTTLGEE